MEEFSEMCEEWTVCGLFVPYVPAFGMAGDGCEFAKCSCGAEAAAGVDVCSGREPVCLGGLGWPTAVAHASYDVGFTC